MAVAGCGTICRTKSLGRLARSVAIMTHRPVMGSLRSSGNYGDSSEVVSSGSQHPIISWRNPNVETGAFVGRTPWSARDALVPHRSEAPALFLAQQIERIQ